jgi:dTDP-4-dehydrorhamnose 3,5-epimerase
VQSAPPVPDGVRLLDLTPHEDPRGRFLEVFRRSWTDVPEMLQWNLVHNLPGAFRGMHLHPSQWDFLIPLDHALVGLHDVRRDSASYSTGVLLEFHADRPQALVIPPGVLHGFFFPDGGGHLYSQSEYWGQVESLVCHWRSPGLGWSWPPHEAILSTRDAEAGDLEALTAELASRGLLGHGEARGV